MAEIVLTTLNARYAHASFGLRYLQANLGPLASRAVRREFTIGEAPLDIVQILLREEPRIVGVGVYIWNARESLEVVALLKRIRPGIVVVVGGPEVSHETDEQEIVRLADHVVIGEGDVAFRDLCTAILDGRPPAPGRPIVAPLPDLAKLTLPYPLYDDEDVRHRVVYVEASRGCPFRCQFCLSSLDEKVRRFPLQGLLEALGSLHDRGVRSFKFVDRTFNLDVATARAILEFFLARADDSLFVHFEMIPDRLPMALREPIRHFPPGCLQFEVGIQTFDPEVALRIERRQDVGKLEDNLRWLRRETGVHVHADLIVGLPGETLAGFARGFDRLWALGPHEIQIGILKRLRGTPIARHTGPWGMIYSPAPPYEVLETSVLSFDELAEMRRFAHAWDVVANSGHYALTLPPLLRGPSPFEAFRAVSAFLLERLGRTHGVSANRLAEALFAYLQRAMPTDEAARLLVADFVRCGRHPLPVALSPYATKDEQRKVSALDRQRKNRRQDAHRAQ
jgi:radical SAM superfamily enzyme YgiQ (UPF0313 family)